MKNNLKKTWHIKNKVVQGEPRTTEDAFLLPTQQPRVQILAPPIFFSLYCLVYGHYVDQTHQVISNGFHKYN